MCFLPGGFFVDGKSAPVPPQTKPFQTYVSLCFTFTSLRENRSVLQSSLDSIVPLLCLAIHFLFLLGGVVEQGEPLLEGVDGTVIEWKTGRNLCEKSTRTKVKRGGSRSGETKMVTRTEKTDSFFKFFQNPVMYHSEDDVDEEVRFMYNLKS